MAVVKESQYVLESHARKILSPGKQTKPGKTPTPLIQCSIQWMLLTRVMPADAIGRVVWVL